MQGTHFWNCFHLLRGKALVFLIFFLAISQSATAQLNYLDYINKKLYFGITLGFNTSRFNVVKHPDFNVNDSILVVNSRRGPGFNLGIIGNYRLSEYFDLRFVPSLAFGDKKLEYFMKGDSTVTRTIESIYVEFPIMVRFKSQPIKDIKLYVLAGMKYSMDLASNAKSRQAEDQVRVSRSDISFELGVGLQIFMPLFIFSPEVKISNGLLNVHARDESLNYSRVIDRLLSRTLIISIHFEG